jgi:hypothetical protein
LARTGAAGCVLRAAHEPADRETRHAGTEQEDPRAPSRKRLDALHDAVEPTSLELVCRIGDLAGEIPRVVGERAGLLGTTVGERSAAIRPLS